MFRKILFISLLLLIICNPSLNAQVSNPVRIGIVLDGPSILVEEVLGLLQQEILSLTKDEFDVHFPEDKTIVADWTLSKNKEAISQLLEDDDVDILMTVGVISTSDLIQRGDLPKPAIGSVVLDAKLQNSPQKGNASGVKNLSYTAIPSEFEEKLKLLHKHTKAKYITVLANNTIDIAIPNLESRLQKNQKDLDFEVEMINLGESIQETFNQINPQTDAVLVAPQTFLSTEDKLQIVNELIKRKLPSYAKSGKGAVELGILMGSGNDDLEIKRLVRRAALNLQSILLGDKPSELPIFFRTKEQLMINMKTARKIGFNPSFDVLAAAKLIHDDFKIAESLSMFEAVQRSIDSNLNLAVRGKEVEAGIQDVRKAWSKLLPQINLANTYTQIDGDRARAALGSAPERTASASAVFNQVLFSDDTFANLTIQQHTQKTIESQREALELDIIEATTKAYLNVLRSARIEQIQMNNLELSRANIEAAKVRKKVGDSSSSDIYRWESEIAKNQKEILSAQANLKNAQLALNRLIHRPLETEYDFKDINLDNREIFLNEDITPFIDNRYTFQLLRDFMVGEAVMVAPEISQAEALIKIRERTLKSNQRDFWIPEVSFQATVTDNYYESGDGVAISSSKNDTDVTALVKATYPLFEGGDKFASTAKAEKELQQFQIQLKALKEQIEEETRSSLQEVGSSHASIKWSRKAAEAAAKNLELIQDSYTEGAADITVLLDAQNASLSAEQVAANAVYDFLIDYFEFQRAIRKFYFRSSNREKEEIMGRFTQFFKANGVDL